MKKRFLKRVFPKFTYVPRHFAQNLPRNPRFFYTLNSPFCPIIFRFSLYKYAVLCYYKLSVTIYCYNMRLLIIQQYKQRFLLTFVRRYHLLVFTPHNLLEK